MSQQTVGNFALTNAGGFVAKIYFMYTPPGSSDMKRSSTGNSILLGQTGQDTPGQLGVPNGSTVYLYVDVVWGSDNHSGTGYLYDSSSGVTASYTISGTTLDNTLTFNGLAG